MSIAPQQSAQCGRAIPKMLSSHVPGKQDNSPAAADEVTSVCEGLYHASVTADVQVYHDATVAHNKHMALHIEGGVVIIR